MKMKRKKKRKKAEREGKARKNRASGIAQFVKENQDMHGYFTTDEKKKKIPDGGSVTL